MKQREFKFRAWVKNYDNDEYEMVSWFPSFFSDMSSVTGWSDEFPNDDEENPDVILMQWVGLIDYHGEDIYEGDIIKYLTHDNLGDIGVVEFLAPAFGVSNHLLHSTVEIIGNIYENPELLKTDIDVLKDSEYLNCIKINGAWDFSESDDTGGST